MVGFAAKRGVNGAPGGGLPAGVSSGDILVWNGLAWVPNVALPFLEQDDWGVDPAGDDAGPGTSADPLETTAELQRRWQGRTFAPGMPTILVQLSGTMPTEKLVLGASFPGNGGVNTQLTIQGTMTSQYSGAVGAFAAFNPAGNVRSSITDVGANFPTHIRRRLRYTSGAASGALSGINPSAGTGVTNGNVGQVVGLTASSYSSSLVPGVGSTYEIETWDTQLAGFDIQLAGAVTTTIRDLDFVNTNAALGLRSYMLSGASQQNGRLFGCRFSGAGVHQLLGWMDWGASQNEAVISAAMGQGRTFGCNFYITTQYVNGAQWVAQQCVHDGGGTTTVNVNVVNGAMLEDINFRAFFGNSAGDALILCDDGGSYQATLAAALLWGGVAPNALNVATAPVRARTQSWIEWITLPTLVASTPGVSDVIYGGTVAAWAAVAGGVINAANGACAAPKV